MIAGCRQVLAWCKPCNIDKERSTAGVSNSNSITVKETLICQYLASPLHAFYWLSCSVSSQSNESLFTIKLILIWYALLTIHTMFRRSWNDHHQYTGTVCKGISSSMKCLELLIAPSLSTETVVKWAENECLYFSCSHPHYVCLFRPIMWTRSRRIIVYDLSYLGSGSIVAQTRTIHVQIALNIWSLGWLFLRYIIPRTSWNAKAHGNSSEFHSIEKWLGLQMWSTWPEILNKHSLCVA